MWVEGPFEERSLDMAWVEGMIVSTFEVKGKEFTFQFRLTFIFRKKMINIWQIKHEYVSASLENIYGIGDWLKNSQQLKNTDSRNSLFQTASFYLFLV